MLTIKKLDMKNLFIILLLIITVDASAQQDPQYTHYMYNMNIVNPAYAGSRGTLSAGLLSRMQWVNIDGAPQTNTFNIHAPIGHQLGLGLSFVSDKIGPVTETNVHTDVSYTLDFDGDMKLALGIKAGASFFNGNLSTLLAPDGTIGQDALLRDNISKTFLNIGIGAYFYTEKYYVGVSVPNMLKDPHFDNSNIAKASEEMHSFLTGGYVFEINKKLDIKPSVMFKLAPNAPISWDLSLNALWQKKFEAGLSYRFDDSLDVLLAYLVSRDFRVGYSYDYSLSRLKEFNSGSHEVFLQYDLNFSKRDVASPRFF